MARTKSTPRSTPLTISRKRTHEESSSSSSEDEQRIHHDPPEVPQKGKEVCWSAKNKGDWVYKTGRRCPPGFRGRKQAANKLASSSSSPKSVLKRSKSQENSEGGEKRKCYSKDGSYTYESGKRCPEGTRSRKPSKVAEKKKEVSPETEALRKLYSQGRKKSVADLQKLYVKKTSDEPIKKTSTREKVFREAMKRGRMGGPNESSTPRIKSKEETAAEKEASAIRQKHMNKELRERALKTRMAHSTNQDYYKSIINAKKQKKTALSEINLGFYRSRAAMAKKKTKR